MATATKRKMRLKARKELPSCYREISEQMADGLLKDIEWVVDRHNASFGAMDWVTFEKHYLDYAKRAGEGSRIIRTYWEKKDAEERAKPDEKFDGMLSFYIALTRTLSFFHTYARTYNPDFANRVAARVNDLSLP